MRPPSSVLPITRVYPCVSKTQAKSRYKTTFGTGGGLHEGEATEIAKETAAIACASISYCSFLNVGHSMCSNERSRAPRPAAWGFSRIRFLRLHHILVIT